MADSVTYLFQLVTRSGFSIVIPFALVISSLSPAVAQDELTFHQSIQAARESVTEPCPLVLCFGAQWCQPCQQMKLETYPLLGIDSAAHQYRWVSIDIDQSPNVATAYSVVSIPSFVVLNNQGQAIGSTSGFMDAESLLSFVADSIANPQIAPPTVDELKTGLATAAGDSLADVIDQVVSRLADPQQLDRDELVEALIEGDYGVLEYLVGYLADPRLAIRAAAWEALAASNQRLPQFDPFAERSSREQQIRSIAQRLGFE